MKSLKTELEKLLDDAYKMGVESEKYDWQDYKTLKPKMVAKGLKVVSSFIPEKIVKKPPHSYTLQDITHNNLVDRMREKTSNE